MDQAENLEVTITAENFQSEVLESDIPVLVDFWAIWCGPCRMLAPVVAEIAQEYKGRVKVGKVNVDEEGYLAGQFNVSSIPTLILFRNGKVEKTMVGARPKAQVEEMLR